MAWDSTWFFVLLIGPNSFEVSFGTCTSLLFCAMCPSQQTVKIRMRFRCEITFHGRAKAFHEVTGIDASIFYSLFPAFSVTDGFSPLVLCPVVEETWIC